jgi:hypothetical protein
MGRKRNGDNGVCQIDEPIPGTVRTLLDASGPFAF